MASRDGSRRDAGSASPLRERRTYTSARDNTERRRRYSSDSQDDHDRSKRKEQGTRHGRDRSIGRRRDRSADRVRDTDSTRHRRRRRSSSIEESAHGQRAIESRRPRREEEVDTQSSRRRNGDRSRSTHRRRERDRSVNGERRRRRDTSPRTKRKHSRSRSPPPKRRRHSISRSPTPSRRQRGPLPSQLESFRGEGNPESGEKPIEKQKPNFNSTGLLAKEANTIAGTNTVLKYHEPAEARKPPSKEQWRLYIFKQNDVLDTIYLFQRSCWLFGRDQSIADFRVEHPSTSKQHAVIQFRYITKTNEYGDREGKVKPYLIDLESANGTKLNGKRVEASRYIELRDKDVVRFGESEREYVMMLPPS